RDWPGGVEREDDARALGAARTRVGLHDLDVVDLVDQHRVREELIEDDRVREQIPFRLRAVAQRGERATLGDEAAAAAERVPRRARADDRRPDRALVQR